LLAACSAPLNESGELNSQTDMACDDNTWLDQEIELLKTLNTTARLTQYVYKGEAVFEVETCLECADRMTIVYTCEGDAICTFGGIAGFNTCPDFYETATNKKVIWHN
jgi:hypothetical protein